MNSSSLQPATTSESNSLESTSDDWRALQFVLGEMTIDESADFAARLADDLALAEAVVRAVKLLEALHAVKPVADHAVTITPLVDQRGIFQKRLSAYSWTALAITVPLLLIAFLWPAPVPSQSPVQLVSYWRTSATWNEHDLDWPLDPTDADASEGIVINEAGVPNWLLLAVGDDKSP